MIYCLSLIFSICLFSLNVVAMETKTDVKQKKWSIEEEEKEALLFRASEKSNTVTWQEFKKVPVAHLMDFCKEYPNGKPFIEALYRSGKEKQKKYFEKILEKNRDINGLYPKLYKGRRSGIYTSFPSPIQWAATLDGQDFFNYVQRCLDAGANIDICEERDPVVTEAATLQDSKYLKFLLDKGADPNIVWYGFTPLMTAALYGHKDNVQLLLDCGADLNWRNERGESALTIAIEKRKEELVQLFLMHQAKIKPIDIKFAEDSGSGVIRNLIVAMDASED